MKWLVLLILVGLASASVLELGDRIVATEQECERLHKLNENWKTSTYSEEAVQYVDLYFICIDSLNEAKYAYIDENMEDMSWYPGEHDKFPVLTTSGQKYVTKPPAMKPKQDESMKHMLTEYLSTMGGNINPLYRMTSLQSEMGQEIIDKQVQCELIALYVLRNPEDKESKTNHTECMTELNCIKEAFMVRHKFRREQYPDYFPILYKRRGTMIKTPPMFEKSICETPDSPEGYKGELDKWMGGIEVIGNKLADIGMAGTDFIEKLARKGMGGGGKVLTRDELNDLLAEAQSVTITDNDGEDDEHDENTYHVYSDLMIEKLAELEAKGVQIVHEQLEKTKPVIKEVEHLASATGNQLKKLEELTLKPTVERSTHELSNAGSNFKTKSKNALEEAKLGLSIAEGMAKMASSKVVGKDSMLMSKFKSKYEEYPDERMTGVTEEHKLEHDIASAASEGWLGRLIDRMTQGEYLPDNYGNTHAPSLLRILKEMGGNSADGTDKMSDDELKHMLKSLKEATKKRAHDMQLTKDEVRQSADVVKSVMHALLYAAGQGYGAAKDMNSKEIDKAKSLVDDLVDYATVEILDRHKSVETGHKKVVMDEDNQEGNPSLFKDPVKITSTDIPVHNVSPTSSDQVLKEVKYEDGPKNVSDDEEDLESKPLPFKEHLETISADITQQQQVSANSIDKVPEEVQKEDGLHSVSSGKYDNTVNPSAFKDPLGFPLKDGLEEKNVLEVSSDKVPSQNNPTPTAAQIPSLTASEISKKPGKAEQSKELEVNVLNKENIAAPIEKQELPQIK